MEKPNPAHADSHRGRSAALVHGLALVAAALALGAVWAVGPKPISSQTETIKILVMGLITVAVLTLWSVVLALQALWRGEPGAWTMSVLGLFTVEVAALSALVCLSGRSMPQQILVRTGLPILVPFGMLVSFVAMPVAFWRVRRDERAEIAAKKPEWNNGRRWKYRFAWYAGIFPVLTAFLLPWPLFPFCACSVNWHADSNSQGDWRNSIASHTPDFIRNTVASLLEQSSWTPVVALHQRIVWNGYLSKIELHRHLNGTSRVLNEFALMGILRSEPAAALEFAMEIADGRRTCTNSMACAAATVIAEGGRAEQIRYCLNSIKSQPVDFTETLIFSLASTPNLQSDVEKVWLKLLADQNPKTRHKAAVYIYYLNAAPDMRTRIILECLKHPDVQVRYGALEAMTLNCQFQPAQDIQISLVKRLFELLDEHDLIQRRGAVRLLSYIVGAGVNTTPMPGSTSPETSGESKDVEAMRAAARKWLAEQKR